MRRSLVGAELIISLAALVVALPPASGQQPAPAAPASDDPWVAHDPASRATINYSIIDQTLAGFVIDEGRGQTSVPYDRLEGDGQRALQAIISGFEGVAVQRLNRNEQLAYWLNLRTMIVLHQTIEDHGSVKPQAMVEGPNAFTTRTLVTVAGQKISVADIDRLILAHWREPHVIYGLVLPARGGPAIPRAAFQGGTVHAQLDAAGREFVNRSGIVQPKAETVRLSSFFIRHRDAIGGDDAKLLDHVRMLAAPKLAAKLPATAVITDRFDWALNMFAERSFDARALSRDTAGSGGVGVNAGGEGGGS